MAGLGSVLGKLFGGAGNEVAGGISGLIGKFIPDKGKKMEMENEITKLFVDHESKLEENITARWTADSKSDSWLSKNIRPLTLAFMIVTVTGMAYADSASTSFQVKEHWVVLYQTLLMTIFTAYFGVRSFEKIMQLREKSKKGK